MSIERQVFATAEKVQKLSSMRRESSSSQNRKAGHTLTHTHTHIHTHIHRTTAIPLLLAYGGEGNNNFFKDIVAQILLLLSLL